MLHARNANVTQAPARRAVLYGAWSVGKDSWRQESFPTDSHPGDFRAGNLSHPCAPPSYRIEGGLWISGGSATTTRKRGNLPAVRRCDVARFERNERNKRNEPWPGPRVGMARRNKRQNRFPARGICYDARARPGPRSKIFSYNEKKSYGGREKIAAGENPFLRIRRGKASGREFVLSMCAARLPRGA